MKKMKDLQPHLKPVFVFKINGQEIDLEIAEKYLCEKCGGKCRYEGRSGEPFRSFAICENKECEYEVEF